MKFLTNPPRCIFFTGKGGVGKTSLACASAVRLADSGKQVLLVSTDPASNVGQVFGLEIGNTITTVPTVPGLSLLEIDPHSAAAAYRERILGPVRGILPETVLATIEEQLSGACTTEIAAFDEFTSLLVDPLIEEKFHHIVFDTAPTGHTIRLLKLPGAWSNFLETGLGDASCLGPLAGLEKQRAHYKAAVEALADSSVTRLVLVARAQVSTLKEAEKIHRELLAIGFQGQSLVINGILSEREAREDPLARAIFEREQRAIHEMPTMLNELPCDRIELKSFNIVGVKSLRGFFEEGEMRDVNPVVEHAPIDFAGHAFRDLLDDLSSSGRGLILVMGKGGVGKTTIASAVAVDLAQRGFSVHLSTTDPASHVSETLSGSIEGLRVSVIDPELETARYQRDVLETKGASLDADGRALLEEDLRSPCTQEVAVFQAFSRVIGEARERFVVLDTAPTGHTLLLLDATGAYHREVARQMDGVGTKNLTTPMSQLQDPETTKVLIVTLAETTPVLEAASLQEDLRRAGIEPWAWIVNNSVAAARPQSRLLQRRAYAEVAHIEQVANVHSKRYAVIPLLEEEPIGVRRLAAMAERDGGVPPANSERTDRHEASHRSSVSALD